MNKLESKLHDLVYRSGEVQSFTAGAREFYLEKDVEKIIVLRGIRNIGYVRRELESEGFKVVRKWLWRPDGKSYWIDMGWFNKYIKKKMAEDKSREN